MAGFLMILALEVMTVMVSTGTVEALQFSVVHKYAHLLNNNNNNNNSGGSPEYFSTLQAHHRLRHRQLLAAVDFPLQGDADPTSIGLYFTQISIGTPPSNFWVDVDTGSDVLWLDCAPCQGCPASSTIPGITLQQYDPTQSSSSMVLPCTGNTICTVASTGACDGNGACAYELQYGDGSTSTGYIINDILTFQQPTATATANIYFGCGQAQTGNLKTTTSAVDGLMGFGQAAISVPSQLAAQGLAAQEFAHCLQGNSQVGGGSFVIGTITEPNILFTPQITGQTHYNVGMQNIAVSGVNITTPATFEIVPNSNEGVIMDSGTTLASLAEPAFTQFLTAVTNAAPVPASVQSDGTSCWAFSGDIATAFPSVTLFFDGGAMPLAPTNYLVQYPDSTGAIYQCMGWQTGSSNNSPSITIWGDIVLKDQLIVYDNVLQRIGWKPFDCTTAISVGT